MLDRAAPTVSITAAASAQVGELVSFGAQASDAGSGLAPGFEWTYGDNTAAGSGESVNHTSTQAGTYQVRVKASDAAGNDGWERKLIIVTAPASGGGEGDSDGAGNGGGGNGGGSGGGTGGGSTGGDDGSADDGSADDAPAESGGFEVSAPRKVKLAKKALPIALTAEARGKVSVALVRPGRAAGRQVPRRPQAQLRAARPCRLIPRPAATNVTSITPTEVEMTFVPRVAAGALAPTPTQPPFPFDTSAGSCG